MIIIQKKDEEIEQWSAKYQELILQKQKGEKKLREDLANERKKNIEF